MVPTQVIVSILLGGAALPAIGWGVKKLINRWIVARIDRVERKAEDAMATAEEARATADEAHSDLEHLVAVLIGQSQLEEVEYNQLGQIKDDLEHIKRTVDQNQRIEVEKTENLLDVARKIDQASDSIHVDIDESAFRRGDTDDD